MNNKKENTSLVSSLSERLFNGILKENPTFVLLLGMCPTLAVTTSAINGFGMGATTLVVLALSNMMISMLRKIIPDKIRIPAFIVIIASFVTIVELLLNAYIPSLYEALGLYIPLIVVNCIILGRAEAYAYSNPVLPSLFDGIGMGLGFTFALTIIGGVREILGAGTVFGMRIMPSGYIPVSIFVMAPGAFFVLALLTAIQNAVKISGTKRGKDMSKIQSGCGGNCLECNKECKVELVTTDDESSNDEPLSSEDLSKEDSYPTETEKEDSVSDVHEDIVETSEVTSVVEEVNSGETTETSQNQTIESVEEAAEASIEPQIESITDTSLETEKDTKQVTEPDVITEMPKVEEPDIISEPESETLTENSASVSDNDISTDVPESTSEVASETEVLEEGDLELLDLTDYKKALHKSTRKPVRKKTSMAKAKAMLNKADEAMKKEEE